MADQFQDINDYDAELQRLARLRTQADAQIKAADAPLPKSYGLVFNGHEFGGAPSVGAVISAQMQRLAGNLSGRNADEAAADLSSRMRQREQDWLTSTPGADATPEQINAHRAQGMQLPSLREMIKRQIADEPAKQADRIEKGEQAAADRVARAEIANADRVARAEADEKFRRNYQQYPPQPRAEPRDRYSVQPGPNGEFYRVNLETGEATPVRTSGASPGPLVKPPGAPTGEERGASGYLGRMQAASGILDKLPDDALPNWTTSAAGAVPSVGDTLRRVTSSPDQQKFHQAASDWVRAKLRKESGAVIGDKEMADEIATYFPQPGESKELRAQKKQARLQAEQQMRDSAGRATPTVVPQGDAAPQRKTINGTTYEKRGGQWFPL